MRIALLTTVAAATLSLSVAAIAQTGSGSTGGASGAAGATTSGGAGGGGAMGAGGASGGASGTPQVRPQTGGSGAGTSASGAASGTQQQGTTAQQQGTGAEQQGAAGQRQQQQGAAGQQGTTGQQQGAASATQADRPATTGSTNINLTAEQRTQVTRAFSDVRAEPLTNVNFNITVGETVPTTVTELHTCPGEVVRYLNGMTECRFVIVEDRIVIVEPETRRIVTVIERAG